MCPPPAHLNRPSLSHTHTHTWVGHVNRRKHKHIHTYTQGTSPDAHTHTHTPQLTHTHIHAHTHLCPLRRRSPLPPPLPPPFSPKKRRKPAGSWAQVNLLCWHELRWAHRQVASIAPVAPVASVASVLCPTPVLGVMSCVGSVLCPTPVLGVRLMCWVSCVNLCDVSTSVMCCLVCCLCLLLPLSCVKGAFRLQDLGFRAGSQRGVGPKTLIVCTSLSKCKRLHV
jgi:hypothetical protein